MDNKILLSPHIGIILYTYWDYQEKKETVIILAEKHKLKWCHTDNTHIIRSKYVIFQNIENSDEVNYIGVQEEFSFYDFNIWGTSVILENHNLMAIYYNGCVYKCCFSTENSSIDDGFSEEESVLIDYIYKERSTPPTEEDFHLKRLEIEKYVNGLNIEDIIESYSIKTGSISPRRSNPDYYSVFIYSTKSTYDYFLNKLLPDFDYTIKRGDIYMGVDYELKEPLPDENKIKEDAKANYSREKHISYLLFNYLESNITDSYKQRQRLDTPKDCMWGTEDPDLIKIKNDLRMCVDIIKLIYDYNNGKYNRKRSWSYYSKD